MSRELCKFCFGSGQNENLDYCPYCLGGGWQVHTGVLPLVDPIQLAKEVMGCPECKCDLVEGECALCPIHTVKDLMEVCA